MVEVIPGTGGTLFIGKPGISVGLINQGIVIRVNQDPSLIREIMPTLKMGNFGYFAQGFILFLTLGQFLLVA